MSLRYRTAIFAVLVVATLAIAIRRTASAKAELVNSTPSTLSSWDQLELKATAAQTGDEPAVRELVHGVFQPFSWADQQEIRGATEDRIVRAEVAFRLGQHPPVSEDNVIEAINGLGQEIGVPEYGKTDRNQLRYLRVGLAMSTPHLVGAQPSEDKHNAVSSFMSPAEASYVALSMLHQKLYNAKYQVTSKEWSQMRNREDWERWRAHRDGHDVSLPSGPRLMGAAASPRSLVIHNAIRRATNQLSPGEFANLPNALLDDMGVSR